MKALWEKLLSSKYEYNSSTEYSAVPRREIPVRGIWGGLREHTSAHGIPHIDNAKGVFKKSMWSVMSVVILGIMLYHLEVVFSKYFGYPVNIKLQIQTDREMTFPAVTICNMNPIKRSAVLSSNPELAGLLLDSSKKKKRRKKRSLDISCSSPSQIHTPSGLCFGLGVTWDTKYGGASGAQRICNDWHNGGIAMPNTLSKFDFIRTSTIFDSLLTNRYWIGIKKDKWEESAPIDLTLFHKFALGHPNRPTYGDCVASDRTVGDEWKSVDCNDLYLPLCQQMIQCPWPLYNDGSDDICYFLLDKSLTMSYSDAKDLCPGYDKDAQLAVIDTPAKFSHLVGSGILSGATEQDYWLYLKNKKWKESTTYTWSNWATTVTDVSDCGMGHLDQSNEWTNEDCNTGRALALCEWRDTFIPYVPFVPNTTEVPSTTVVTTQVFTSEITTNQPSTEQLTTLWSTTTDRPTTDTPTTDTPTDTPTTDLPTTETTTTNTPTTDTPTTDTPTTRTPTIETPTTDTPTTNTPTTDTPTSDTPTSDTPTSEFPTTVTPTTDTPTTDLPTTEIPKTETSTTESPTSNAATIVSTTSDTPTTVMPTTVMSTSVEPTTDIPTTVKPTSDTPTTECLTTVSGTTNTSTTVSPTSDTPRTATSPTTTSTIEMTTTDPPTTRLMSTVASSSVFPTSTAVSGFTSAIISSPHTTTTNSTTTSTTTATTTTTTLPPTTTPSPGAPPPPPATIPGSQFPERIPVRENFQEGEKAFEILANIPDEQKAAMGYTADEFLLDCQYNGYVCSPTRDFSRFYNGIHGNCYIFNSGWNKSVPLRKSQKTGRRYGLKAIVNIGQDEYTDQFGEEAGARVVLHPQDRMPFPEDEGVLATPGSLTTIGVRKITVKRLPKPFGTCTQYDSDKIDLSKNVFQEVYPVNYSKNSCLKTCYQYYVITECGCADPYYPKDGVAFPKPVVSACDPTNVTQDDCKYNISRRFILNQLDCDCPPSCNNDYYTPTVSFAQWPSDIQVKFISDAFAVKIPGIFNDSGDKMLFRRNLIKIEVYYEDLNSEAITEKAAYGVFQFLSDIGGTLGLWLGFSLMTTFEFLEFGADMLVFAIIRSRGKSSGRSRPVTSARAPICVNDIRLGALSPTENERAGGPRSSKHGEFPESPPPSYTSSSRGVDSPITPVELAE